MTVTAAVTDRETGAPAANADVVMAAVDEAVFALQEQDSDILSGIYRILPYPPILRFVSYSGGPSTGGGAERGGGGGDEGPARSNFADTAYFASAKTDSGGNVRLSFALPDNITSWRLTALALTENGRAGSSIEKVASTKPYFVNAIVNGTILENDSFTVGLRSAGTGVADTDAASYTVTVNGPSGEQVKTVDSTVKTLAFARFDGLTRGEYRVTVSGKSKGFTDKIELPFEVKTSAIEIARVKTVSPAEGLAVDSLRYPVSVAVYNRRDALYRSVLANVAYCPYTQRADVRIAKKAVSVWFEDEGVTPYAPDEADSLSDLTQNYMLRLFPYSQDDASLSVLARLAAPDLFLGAPLVGLTPYDSVQYYHSTAAAALLAQAIAGEEFTADIAEMLADGSLPFEDRMMLVAALATSGQTDAAKAAYAEYAAPNLEELTGISGETALYVRGRTRP
jgi:hypothetical protein